eukprot:842135-Prymnesium_polylepis.1
MDGCAGTWSFGRPPYLGVPTPQTRAMRNPSTKIPLPAPHATITKFDPLPPPTHQPAYALCLSHQPRSNPRKSRRDQ